MLLTAYSNVIGWLESHQLPCIIKGIFHVECPGCGIQRSCIALLRGDVTNSIRLYPALLPLLAFFLFLLLDRKYNFNFSTFIIKPAIACIFIIILSFYIFKLTSLNNYL